MPSRERPKTGLAARAAANSKSAEPYPEKIESTEVTPSRPVIPEPAPERSAAEEHELREELRPRRYVDRTFRLKPEQVHGLKKSREDATQAIGYPKVTMDEIARISIQHFLDLPAEEALAVVQRLRGQAS